MSGDFATFASARIRSVPDWPEPGVTFRDITPLLADAQALATTMAALTEAADRLGPVDKVVGVEARGFVLASPIAVGVGAGFVPVRKAGKLPAAVESRDYGSEYGSATLEIHRDAIAPGERVLIVDDVLATGGTLAAVRELVAALGGEVIGELVLVELADLGARRRLGESVTSLLVFADDA